MPDMLVRLYDLPDASPYLQRVQTHGIRIRRAEPWDRERLKHFISQTFNPLWAVEAERAFSHWPISAYLATQGPTIVGFAAYECSRRGFFGPTGVLPELRGKGIGAALLLRSLQSMWEMGYAYAIIGGVGPAAFYEKVCGAFTIPGSDTSVYGTIYEIMQKEP